MNFLTPLWIVDNLLSVIFFRASQSKTIFPEIITSVNEERYYQVQSRIIDFKTKMRFSSDAEIELSASDINSVLFFSYCSYQARSLGDKAFSLIGFFEIQDDEIIMNEIASFLIFKFRPLEIKKYLKFKLSDGEICESKKIVSFLGKNNKSSEYVFVESKFSTNLIHQILISSEYSSIDNYSKSSIHSNRLLADPLVKKIKSIRISNNQLILRA